MVARYGCQKACLSLCCCRFCIRPNYRQTVSSAAQRGTVEGSSESEGSMTAMQTTAVKLIAAATLAVALAPAPAAAQSNETEQLGNVHFETSCNEVAQRRFDRAMRYQHSFWYRAARDIFEEAAKADAQCGIAYWGVALGYLDNPHGP